ncbi:hypothetical protein Goari_020890 [Gossypium aridum]|uniref:Uncharacterized protein n=1 Tax=Gossypium aridum TaxID=34290 RepID=A0A7J8YCP9_GOSAI|nr:hypothetical protein [Gossypium aridum]
MVLKNVVQGFKILRVNLVSVIKLESDLSKLGVTEIDDMLLNVRDAEFTGLELSWMKEKLTNSRKKILENETKIKMLETIRQANLELARLKKRP